MSISESDKKLIWHPYTQMKTSEAPIPIVKGDGIYVYDESGKKYIDAVSSWWVNLHGHSHPYIAEKISEQMKVLEHVIFAGFTHPKAVELAERLIKKLPTNQSKIFYSDDGSTSVEVAVKMVFQYWHNKGTEKKKIIAFKNAYHGDTFGAMSVSGRSAFTMAFTPFLFDVIFIDAPVKGKEKKSAEQLKKIVKNNDIAAFIFEPLIQGAGGMIMHEPEPLEQLVEICTKAGILTIADEVMTGFGRTGKFFATDYINVKPDVFCLSKGLTGGTLPLGITSCTKEIYNAFLSDNSAKTFFHGHSYTANPVACTAAIASLDLLEKNECWENIKMIERKHKEFCNTLKGNRKIKRAESVGTIMALEIETVENTSYLNSLKDNIYNFFIKRGIILRPLGNVIYFMPPYCIKEEELNIVYKAIRDFLGEI
ncbi:MAG: adenosylmethionine--8-amino-7-oxononanoate transaminase [Bacteroidales bacterium]|nr:adenosylmethionine--8-amino-7-oxononanoate transaminase [Bacteroidales bacterium]